jgi:hypothetical protein
MNLIKYLNKYRVFLKKYTTPPLSLASLSLSPKFI